MISAMGEKKIDKRWLEMAGDGGMAAVVLNMVVRVSLIEKVATEQRLEGGEGVMWTSGEKHSKQRKYPVQNIKVAVCLVPSKNSK